MGIGSYLVKHFTKRPPDIIVASEDYMHRWYVIPRNKYFNIYFHKILGSDVGRDLHDHPWWNLSWILEGNYTELVPAYGKSDPYFRKGVVPTRLLIKKRRKAGQFIFRLAKHAHRLETNSPVVYTLFITGPRRRVWGFWTSQGWTPFNEYKQPYSKPIHPSLNRAPVQS